MKDLNKILMSKQEPETRVYLIAKELHEAGKLNDELWYAVLDLQQKHFREIENDIAGRKS